MRENLPVQSPTRSGIHLLSEYPPCLTALTRDHWLPSSIDLKQVSSVMAEERTTIFNDITSSEAWSTWFDRLQGWFTDSLATTETTVEILLIALAALIARLLSLRIRQAVAKLGERHSGSALLKRWWRTLDKIAFPTVWLGLQWLIIYAMSELGLRHSAVVITSSLLSAWIVIRVMTVFVANQLWSTIIAASAWIVAALSILGLFDTAVAVLASASFSFGQLNITALTVVQGLIALAVLLWITALVGQLLEGRIRSSSSLTPSIQVLTTKLMRIGLALVALLFTLSIVGIDLTVFAVFGGAIGVGLGFGLQKVFANLVSGFILLLDKSIKPGDVIAVDTDYGRVNSLGARYVSVLTRDGIEHLIPNEELIITRVENWTHSHSLVRLRKTVGVHYKADIHKAMALCLQAADETPRVLTEPAPVCLLTDFADSAVNLEIRFWIDDPMNGRANVISLLMLNIWDKFHAHDIEIPYPQRDLHLRSSDLPTGDDSTLT